MVIWSLLAVFVILLIVSYLMCKKDIMQPSVLFCAVYVVSILCAIYNIDNWSIDLGWGVFAILTLGAIEFLVINYAINRYFARRTKNVVDLPKPKEITVKRWKIIVVILYDLVAVGLLLSCVLKIAGEYKNYSSLGEAINVFKDHTSYRADSFLPTYISIIIKPIEVFGYVFSFVFMNNMFFSEGKISRRLKDNIIFLVPVIIFILRFLLTSTRGSILQLMVGMLFLAGLFWYDKVKWQRSISLKRIIKVVIAAVIVLYGFYVSGLALQRRISVGAMDYLTMYAGGSIVTFDEFLKTTEPPSSAFPGAETFPSIVRRLYQMDVIKMDKAPVIHLNWIYRNGRNIGNVYTAYRRWLNDFGYAGMFILNALMAAFFGISYNLIKYKRGKFGNIFVIVYMYLLYFLLMHSIVSIFYNTVFSVGFVLFMVVLFVGYRWLVPGRIIGKPALKVKK